MPVYQISYDNINTDEVKKALSSILKQEIKDDELTYVHPICHAQASVWFIDTPNETVGTDLRFVKFDEEDIIVTKISGGRNSVKANNLQVKKWLDYHLR